MEKLAKYIFAVMLPLFAIGCFESFGQIKPDLSAADIFEQRRILAGYKYYTHGSPLKPVALLAISNRFHLKTSIWTPVDITRKRLSILLDNINDDKAHAMVNRGAVILGPGGEKIGFLYSSKNSFPPVRMLDERTVVIYDPEGTKESRPFLPIPFPE